MPGRGHRLKQTDHQAAHLLPEIGIAIRILQNRSPGGQTGHVFGNQVVVLGGLYWQVDASEGAKLSRPHTRTIDHVLRPDHTLIGNNPRDPARLTEDTGDSNPFCQGRAPKACTLGKRHGDIDRVSPAVFSGIEGPNHVIKAGSGPVVPGLGDADFVTVDSEIAHERR